MVARYRPKKPRTGRTYFTEEGVQKLKVPGAGQVESFEKLKRGLTLVLRRSYGGTKAWRVLYYTNGRPAEETLAGRTRHGTLFRTRPGQATPHRPKWSRLFRKLRR